MEEIKPKKERKFLKAMGDIALTLFRELVLGIGKKVINKVGNKRQGLVITFVIIASTFAIAQFPNTLNKQRLGFQTTADGLTWRGSISDTASIQPINNQNAWVILDTINLKFYTFDFTSNVWNLVGGALTMPFDSITFNTAKNGTVGVGEVEYNDTQGSLIQGLKGGNVNNVIGQQLHQRVNNRTGAPLAKGDVVYLAGSQGNRITVAKGLAVTDAFSANTFGVVAEAIADNQSGFIITEGLITGLNTSALTEDSAVYLSPTVAGALTSTKPQAPQHSVYIGVCVKSSNGSGELFVKIRNGQELDELHDTRITNPVTGATLFYSGGLWRDTTAALLVSDTASMLTPYLRKADTTSLINRVNLKVNISDTLNMLLPYLRKSDTTNMLLPYFRDADTTLLNLTSRFATKLNISDTASMLTPYLRKADTTNMLLPYFRDADTSLLNLTSRFAAKQNNLTNPVTGTGTNNFVPKFTTTGSTIGNSTIQDNGTTVSTSSILSTTNYASFNTTQVVGTSSGMLSTHRFTSANANGLYNKNWFLTSYMGAPWQGSDVGAGNRSKPPIVAIINNNDSNLINSGLHLMTTKSNNNTYTPAITFGVNSENEVYYNTIGAITAKKLNTGQFTSQSAGQLEFFGTGTALDATGASMTTANMTLGVGVGIGYTTAPTVRGRLTVLEKLGINQSTPAFALDVSGTANITGATTLGSTLNVTGNLGINTTSTSGANLIIKNSQEPSRATVVTTQTFAADTTNWTRGTGWTFSDGVAVATAATGDLTYTAALTITSGNAYEIRYTLTNYSAGTLTIAFGNGSYLLPTHNVTSNFILILPTTATGGFRFTTSSFTGNIDNVSVVEITNRAPVLFAGQDDNSATLYNSLRMPTFSTLAFGGGAANTTSSGVFLGFGTGTNNTTGTNNVFIGNLTGEKNTTGFNNVFLGTNSGRENSIGSQNVFIGNAAGRNNTTGGGNIFIGSNSGFTNTTGSNNYFAGSTAGQFNTTGSDNVFIGPNAGQNNTTGFRNVILGTNAGLNNTTGASNFFFGQSAGRSNTTGTSNIAIGDFTFNQTGVLTTGSSNLIIGLNAGDNITGSASGNVIIGNAADLPDPSGSNQVVIKNVYFATGASGTGTGIAALSKAGIKTATPNRDLEVAGEVRITDLTTDTPTRLVGADADGDLGQVTLGAGLSLASSSLLADTNFLVTRFDTASMLTNYLRSGVAASTYISGSGTANYLPKFDATKSITLSALINNGSSIFVNPNTQSSFGWDFMTNTSNPFIGNNVKNGSAYERLQRQSTTSLFYPSAIIFGYQRVNNSTAATSFGGINFMTTDSDISGDINPIDYSRIFIQPNGNVGIGTMEPSYKFDIRGTLGVTGATTLSAPLTVNSSAVFNEGSADADFRVEGDANANMIFVDASTDRVGIGTNTPAKTLDVNGELNVSSAGTFGGRLNTNWLERTYSNSTATSLTVSVNTTWLKLVNNSTITLTLPNAATYPGKELHVKNAGTGAVNSLSSNIEPLNSTTIGTAILASGGGKWATLVSDGTYWVIMAGN